MNLWTLRPNTYRDMRTLIYANNATIHYDESIDKSNEQYEQPGFVQDILKEPKRKALTILLINQ